MSNLSNGAPRFILEGIRDESVLAPVPVPEVYAQHLPHLYILAERGPLTPQLLDPSLLTAYYGSKTFDPLSKYYTMGSEFTSVIAGNGNSVMVQRVHPADALAPAYWTLGIEIVEDEIIDYKRDVDGVAERDANGDFVLDTTKRTGRVARLVVNNDVGTVAFGAAVKKKGLMTSSTGVQSDYYPILDIEIPSPGEFGDNVGFSLWAPTSQSTDPLNVAVAVDQLSQLFRLRTYERPDVQSTAVLKLTADRQSEINFSFKKTVVDTATAQKYNFALRVKDYNNEQEGFTPVPGPIGRTKVYYDNLDAVLKMIYADEKAAAGNSLLDGVDAHHQINFLGGVDFYNNPYYTFRVQGVADGGINLNDVAIYYAEGGSDGAYEDEQGNPVTKIQMYNKLCKEQFDNYGDLKDIEVLDDARYPQSAYWDCGYDLETKKSLISITGKRKDIIAYIGTYIDGHDRLTGAEQRSMASALRSYARLFPESTLYGTGVCRVIFFMQSGQLVGDDSEQYYPHLLDHAYKRSRYAGSGDGVLKNAFAYDAANNNRVQILRNMDLLWEQQGIRDNNWNLGLNYAQNVNRSQAYVPHVQTVYAEESSVLRDEIALTICVDIEKKCQQAYRMLGVDTRRTTEQNLSELNTILTDLTKDLYDGRVDISVNSFRTTKDINSRVRYSCEVSASFNKGQYIGSFTVVSRNREDNA